MCDIAVLIPCFNEEATIYKVVQDFASVFQSYDGSVRIYVYDNNSTDSTAEQAVRAGAVVRHEYRRGKGNVVRRMFREIEAECYIMVDGDDTYPADSAVEMADFVLNRQADMVIGDRLSASYFNENKRPFHNFGNILVRKSINALFHCEIKDIMTGYRAFSRGFVKSFPVLSEGFEIETEMSIHAIDKNMNIQHVVVSYRDRPDGSESKLNTYTDGLKVLFMIVKMFRNYRPQTFFCSIAFLFVLSANVFFWPVFIDFVHTGLVERFPTLIVCGFAAIASIQSFFAGLILENLREKDRRDFEMHLIQNRYDKTEMIGEKHKKKNMGGYLMSEYRKPVNVKNDMGGGTAGCFDKRMSEIFQLLPYIPGQLEQFLDVGFGRGQISEYLVKQGKHVTAIGLELESYGIMLEKYKKDGIQLVEADAEKMPFESETFDCVIASHVLEHVHNMGLVLSEMRRVLKDEGWLVIFIPRFTNCVCAGHINTGWNLGQLMYVLLLNKFNIRQGKFIEFGYSLCAMVKKEEFDLPPLRGDRGDIHILNEAHLFPAEIEMKNGLADGFEGNIKAVNWSDAEELIAKSIYPAGKLRIILALKKIMVRLIGARQTRMIGELLVSGNQVNPDKFIY